MQLHSFSRRCNVTAIPGAVALICLPNSILSWLHISETKCPDSLARASNDRSNSFAETHEYPYLKYFATLFQKFLKVISSFYSQVQFLNLILINNYIYIYILQNYKYTTTFERLENTYEYVTEFEIGYFNAINYFERGFRKSCKEKKCGG